MLDAGGSQDLDKKTLGCLTLTCSIYTAVMLLLYLSILEKGLTAVLVWLTRITGLAANYLLWRVSLSKNQVIKMRYLSVSLSLTHAFFFFPLEKNCAGHEKSGILFEVEEQFLIIGTKNVG